MRSRHGPPGELVNRLYAHRHSASESRRLRAALPSTTEVLPEARVIGAVPAQLLRFTIGVAVGVFSGLREHPKPRGPPD